MKLKGIKVSGVKLKGCKLEPVKRYANASQAIAAKKRPKQKWKAAK